jgi:hypothetical protein
MHRLRHEAKAQVGRLLRVLLVRVGAVSTNSGAARGEPKCGVALCLIGNEQSGLIPSRHQFARWWIPLAAIVVGLFVPVSLRTAELGHRSRLDGCGVLAECTTL